jgi:hypothetical protein
MLPLTLPLSITITIHFPTTQLYILASMLFSQPHLVRYTRLPRHSGVAGIKGWRLPGAWVRVPAPEDDFRTNWISGTLDRPWTLDSWMGGLFREQTAPPV